MALALLLGGPRGAAAQSGPRLLDAPRASGQVGEQNDGFAVARGTVPPDVAKLVAEVNEERRAVYAKRAAEQKVPAEAIGKIYAAEIIKSAPPGTWYQDGSGKWVQK